MPRGRSALRLAFSVTALSLAAAAGAACGSPAGESGPRAPTLPNANANANANASASAGAGAGNTGPPTGPSTAATRTPTGPGTTAIAARPVTPTAMASQLSEIGLDPKALPAMNKLSPDQLRKVMKTFTKALGVTCDGCHDTKDFRAATPHKKIATHMWNDFSRALATPDGQPVYCDSCHGGRAEFLDRRDTAALSNWMQENYVDKLKRVDQKDHGCETCHGDPMEPKIFAKLWK